MINVANDQVQKRQNQYYVGNYYDKVVKRDILKNKKPTPILAKEMTIMNSIGSFTELNKASNSKKRVSKKQSVMTNF